MRKATFGGGTFELLTVVGYIVEFEPEAPAKRDVLRPVAPDEPDTEVEVGYSQNALEPLTLVFRDKKIELTRSAFILFRYINDLYRAEGQEEFEFSELSEVLAGDEFGKSKSAIESLVRRINVCLVKIRAPILLTFYRETAYVAQQK
jgi:hypothetical protein